jgi:NADH-quinone oxidoreductase subunit L
MELQGTAALAHYFLLLPVLASIVSAFITRRWPLASALVSWASTGSCLLLAARIFQERLHSTNPLQVNMLKWVNLGPSGLASLPMGLMIDNLSSLMLLMVCFIGLLIQIYSYAYMSVEVKHFPTQGPTTVSRFFACLNLFLFAMLGLVLSASTVQIYIFWELVGLCSYLLIGFWFFKTSAAVASRKAFVVTKFADLGFLLGVLCLGVAAQTFAFPDLLGKDLSGVSQLSLNLGLVLLFCGAIGKSAQFPLHIWLPDAMEGPTPVSALIHAATMVAAGVYLVARCAPLYAQAPWAATTVAWIGAITAIVAASVALVQSDIKKILAYSTVSQLGFMLTALGAAATGAGVFHLVTHAFFKALLFLGSGAVIVACHSNNIWDMGGLKRHLPFTHFAFLMGCLALAGVPPFAGFFSKDEILAGLVHRPLLLAVLAFTAFLTAFYVGRLYFVAFAGNFRGHHEDDQVALPGPTSPALEAFGMKPFWSEERAAEQSGLPPECLGALSEHVAEHHGPPHEVSPVMYGPLLILAFFAVTLGWTGTPWANYFGHFVVPTAEHHGANLVLMVASALVAFGGLGLAYAFYGSDPLAGEKRLRGLLGPLEPVLRQRWYMDHFWAWALTHLVYLDARFISRFDEKVVDGAVYASGRATYQAGQVVRQEQSGQVQRYALMLVAGFLVLVVGLTFVEPEFLFPHWVPSDALAPKPMGGLLP